LDVRKTKNAALAKAYFDVVQVASDEPKTFAAAKKQRAPYLTER
jgi:hypothetical protein